MISLNSLPIKKFFIQQGPKVRWGPVVVSVKDYRSQKQREIRFKSLEPTKGQLNSEWIYEVIVFPKSQPKIAEISALPSDKPSGQKSR